VVVTIQWENVGVAPPYRDCHVALRLSTRDDRQGKACVVVTDNSIRGWLPGTQKTELRFKLPESARAGVQQLAVGVVDPASREPAVRLAIPGRDATGWYPVSELEVVR
jgi:hypothetical protein